MYHIQTNFGEHTVKFMPSLEDMTLYYHRAHQKGIAPKDIVFKVTQIECESFSRILSETRES